MRLCYSKPFFPVRHKVMYHSLNIPLSSVLNEQASGKTLIKQKTTHIHLGFHHHHPTPQNALSAATEPYFGPSEQASSMQSCPPEGFTNCSRTSSNIPIILLAWIRNFWHAKQATASRQLSEEFLSYLKFAWVGSWDCDKLLSLIPALSIGHLFGRAC